MQKNGQFDHLLPISRLTHHFKIFLAGQHALQACTDDRMIVSNQNTKFTHIYHSLSVDNEPVSIGKATTSVVPSSGALSMVMLPCNLVTRSLNPFKPNPPACSSESASSDPSCFTPMPLSCISRVT